MTAERAAVAWAVSLGGLVPHLIEDFAYRVPQRFGLTPGVAAWLLGLVLVVQAASALASTRGSRRGLAILALTATGWVLVALADHWRAFLPVDFRGGVSSRLWVWILIGGQLAAAWIAVAAMRRGRR